MIGALRPGHMSDFGCCLWAAAAAVEGHVGQRFDVGMLHGGQTQVTLPLSIPENAHVVGVGDITRARVSRHCMPAYIDLPVLCPGCKVLKEGLRAPPTQLPHNSSTSCPAQLWHRSGIGFQFKFQTPDPNPMTGRKHLQCIRAMP